MVRLVSEILNERDKMLIVEEKTSLLSNAIKQYLETYNVSVFKTPHLPSDFSHFKRVFLINPRKIPETRAKQPALTIFIIKNKSVAERFTREITLKKKAGIKVIFLNQNYLDPTEIDSLLWFAFSSDSEPFLDYQHLLPDRKKTFSEVKKIRPTKTFDKLKKRPKVMTLLFVLVVLFGFVPFLFISTTLNYLTFNRRVDALQTCASSTNSIAYALYTPVRPIYLLFSLALIPDTILQLNNDLTSVTDTNKRLNLDLHTVFRIFFASRQNNTDQKELLLHLDSIDKNAQILENATYHLGQSLPSWTTSLANAKKEFRTSSQLTNKLQKVLPIFKELVEKKGRQRHLILIADNNNLRAGGGLINFLGVVELEKGTVITKHFFSSSDVTSSTSAEFAPPDILKQYANENTLRLEDIAYSPDFTDVSSQTRFFLERQTQLKNFDSVILVTTDGLKDILAAFPQLFLTKSKEKITKDNISIKLSLHKNDSVFIDDLFETMSDTIDTADDSRLISSIAKALDEKQIVVSFTNPSYQKIFDELYWSGKTITPQCIVQNGNCVNDYFYSVDQNMTENNIDAYIRKKLAYQIHIDNNGLITNSLLITIQNDSPFLNTQNGLYHNYFQILLPKNSSIDRITKNGTLVESYDEVLSQYKIIGFYLEIPAGSTSNILITYKNGLTIQSNDLYQLIVQKQIGTGDTDFSLRLQYPSNYHVDTQNFIPVVKDREIFYNTSLNTDKLFFVQFK